MSPLEIISRLCDVTENLSAIVKKQQTIIEQSKICLLYTSDAADE